MKKTKKSKVDRSIAERWSARIASKGFTSVPSVFLANYAGLNITTSEAMLLIHLASFKWSREMPFPSVKRLAALMGCSDRNIRKMCASLEGVGYIRRITRDGTSNLFDLSGLFSKLEGILGEEPAVDVSPAAALQ